MVFIPPFMLELLFKCAGLLREETTDILYPLSLIIRVM